LLARGVRMIAALTHLEQTLHEPRRTVHLLKRRLGIANGVRNERLRERAGHAFLHLVACHVKSHAYRILVSLRGRTRCRRAPGFEGYALGEREGCIILQLAQAHPDPTHCGGLGQ